MRLPFLKMHGAGNDLVVIDRRGQPGLDPALAARIADRRFGVGCDQLVVLEDSKKAEVFMRLYNADGGEISACGNASRCVAMLVGADKKTPRITIETRADVLEAELSDDGITVMMGEPKWEWRDIPLSESRNTLHLGLEEGGLRDPVAVSMGNPHMVFFVRDADAAPLERAGPKLEHDPLFPQRANVSVVQVIARDHIKLRTWERGAGLTMACGTAACATVVAAVRRELCDRNVRVDVPGGTLFIEWRAEDGRVYMTGPAVRVFEGTLAL